MRIIRGIRKTGGKFKRTCIGIGVFDGVHIGHQRILREVTMLAKQKRATPVAVTFVPHPAFLLSPEAAPPLLMSDEQRLSFLGQAGLEYCVVLPFNRKLARTPPEDFVRRVICGPLKAVAVCVGKDFVFGAGKIGNVETLKKLGRKLGFTVRAVPPVKVGKTVVSSSEIRKLVSNGDLDMAARMLGRPHVIAGTVVKGAGRGRGLGSPTANISSRSGVIPPDGVYIVNVRLGSRVYNGLCNIGKRPTFESGTGKSGSTVEVHILGFDRNIYGRKVQVFFLRKLREEVRHASPAELAARIRKDIALAKSPALE